MKGWMIDIRTATCEGMKGWMIDIRTATCEGMKGWMIDSPFRHMLAGCDCTLTSALRFHSQEC